MVVKCWNRKTTIVIPILNTDVFPYWIQMYSHIEYRYIPILNTDVFPYWIQMYSHIKYKCIPILNTDVFPYWIQMYSHIEYRCIPILNTDVLEIDSLSSAAWKLAKGTFVNHSWHFSNNRLFRICWQSLTIWNC